MAVVYGSTSGNTEDAAKRLTERLERRLDAKVPCLDVGVVEPATLTSYDVLALGVPTWDIGLLQADWDDRLDELTGQDFRGVRVALFGAGDPVFYPDTFGDALGIVAERFEAAGATLVAPWPHAGYDFEDSRALRGDMFVGLLLNYDGEEERVDELLDAWCDRLVSEVVGTQRSQNGDEPADMDTASLRGV